jgi:hypothetical protein
MQRLERCDVIYADGTFKVCPPVTKELFAVSSSLPFSLKYYIIDIVRNVGQQSTSGSI